MSTNEEMIRAQARVANEVSSPMRERHFMAPAMMRFILEQNERLNKQINELTKHEDPKPSE